MLRIKFTAVIASATIAIAYQAVCLVVNPAAVATSLPGALRAVSHVPGAATPQSTATEFQTPAAHFEPPPMGWSSWNSFSNTVNSDVMQREAKVIASSGLRDLGYQFVNIDEGWWLGKRDEHGNIVVDPAQWPALEPGERAGDMSNIVKYLHSLGLKAGIYTDAGEAGCSFYGPDLGPPVPHTGSEGHYEEDFLQFANWGFDYVKVDWCGGSKENLDPAVQYEQIAHAIQRAEHRSGHRLYYSICDWGNNSPWTWAPGLGGVPWDIWRTSGDIVAPVVAGTQNGSRTATLDGVLSNFDRGIHMQAQHTGYYNDLDMMMIGMPGLSETQNRLHMSLWAISGAPLILGLDLTRMDDATRAILTNKEVIAIDQDPLGLQCMKVAEVEPGLQVWTKPLAAQGERALLLINRTGAPAKIGFLLKQLGLDPSSPASVRDLWQGEDLGRHTVKFEAVVPPGDVKLLTLRGVESQAITFDPATFENASALSEIPGPGALDSASPRDNGHSTPVVKVRVPHSEGAALVRVSYINPASQSLFAELKVQGQHPTTVAFPPTGGREKRGSIAFEIECPPGTSETELQLSFAGMTRPELRSISIQPIGIR